MPRRFSLNVPLTIVVIFWAFNFPAMKRIYIEIPPATVCFVRHIVIWALLASYCFLTKRSLKLPREDAFRILLCGLTSMGLYMIPFLEGLKLTSPTNCAIILAIAPILTILFAWVAGQERSSSLILLAAGVAFIGVAIVIAGGPHVAQHTSLLGDGLVLLSAAIWAVATVIMRPLLAKYDPIPLFTMSLPGALPVLLPYGLYSIIKHPVTHISLETSILFAHVTLLSGVVAFVCYYTGFRQTNATTTTMYQFCIPPVAAFFSWLYVRQAITLTQILGICVVIAGVWAVSIARQRLLVQSAPA